MLSQTLINHDSFCRDMSPSCFTEDSLNNLKRVVFNSVFIVFALVIPGFLFAFLDVIRPKRGLSLKERICSLRGVVGRCDGPG